MRLDLPSQINALDNWLDKGRDLYYQNIDSLEKETLPEHPKVWREWWCLKNLLEKDGWQSFFGDNFTAVHSDFGQSGPDFTLTLSDGSVLALEVTEATTSEDRLAIKRSRVADDVHLVGELGGRGRDGWVGNEPERLVAADIADAIQRKNRKRYRERAALLIYVNSNPSSVVNNVGTLAAQIAPLPHDSVLEFALVVVNSLPLICVERSQVSIL